MTILKAADYASREELENKVRSLVPLTPEAKPDYQIKGKRDELARLLLSDIRSFYGISCVITDSPTVPKDQRSIEKVNRGEQKEFGINNNNLKNIP